MQHDFIDLVYGARIATMSWTASGIDSSCIHASCMYVHVGHKQRAENVGRHAQNERLVTVDIYGHVIPLQASLVTVKL